MKNDNKNTFGDYKFPDWVPLDNQKLITDFWGVFGRTFHEWLENGERDASKTAHHGPGPNGFRNPPLGATADYILLDYKLTKEVGDQRFKIVRGRYIHHWNNIGSLIDEYGEAHHVSSCDRWVRVWLEGESAA